MEGVTRQNIQQKAVIYFGGACFKCSHETPPFQDGSLLKPNVVHEAVLSAVFAYITTAVIPGSPPAEKTNNIDAISDPLGSITHFDHSWNSDHQDECCDAGITHCRMFSRTLLQ